MKRLCHDNKGSVLVMAIIITAGLLIVAIEFAVFAVNGVRQARAIDKSLFAYYAAEAGVESALYQVRKETLDPVDTLNRNEVGALDVGLTETAQWDLADFGVDITEFYDAFLGSGEALEVALYTDEGATPLNISSMKMSWEDEVNCSPVGTPWIEARGVAWTGSPLQWGDASDVRAFTKTPTTPGEVVFNSVSGGEVFDAATPMVVRVKSLYCDLSGVKLSFYDSNDALGSVVTIPTFYRIRSVGTFDDVQQAVEVTVPRSAPLSGLFDYVFFSEQGVRKP